MWIASKLGWFSIVEKSQGEFHIRARVRKDLENLCAGMDLGEGDTPEIQTWPGADYRYRIVVDRADAMEYLMFLFRSIDYSNFKSEIAATPDQRAKLHSYHDIWAIMMRHQAQGDAANER